MATVIRGPIVQGPQRHPSHIGLPLFQPNNLLTQTLVAATLSLTLHSSDDESWKQVQHPSRLAGYLNPDTSRGMAKVLLPELKTPDGRRNLFLQAPEPILARLNPDTSRGTPRQLAVELVRPVGSKNPFLDAPPAVRTDTSSGSQRAILTAVPPPPFVPTPPLFSPRPLTSNLDTSRGTPRTLGVETRLPVGAQNVLLRTPEPIRINSSLDVGQGIMDVTAAVSPIFPPPSLHAPAPVRINADTTAGTPKTLRAETVLPIGARDLQTPPPYPRTVVNTSVGTPETLRPELALPSGRRNLFLPPMEVPRINADATRGTPRTMAVELRLPTGSTMTAQYSAIRYTFNVVDTSTGASEVLFAAVVPPPPTNLTPLFIANMGKMMSRH